MSLIEYLEQKKIPQTCPALIEAEGGRVVTYEELWEQVRHLASGFRELGIRPKERVVLVLPNSTAWVVSFLAILKVGGIVVPFRQTATSMELKRLIRSVKPSLFIGDSSFINRSLPFDLLDGEEQVIISSKQLKRRAIVNSRINRLDELLVKKYPEWKSISKLEPNSGLEQMSRVASINYTFRGYGYPLGAMLTHGNYLHGIETYVETVGLHEGQRFLAALPLSHVYPLVGCLLASLATGSTSVLVRSASTQQIWEAICRFYPDILTGVPTLYSRLLHSMSSLGSSLQDMKFSEALCGGSVMPISLYERIRSCWGISLRQGYGLTECLPVTCNPSVGNRPETLGRTAIGVNGIKIKVVGENANGKFPGETGEIVVAGPTVMAGYYSMPRETSEAIKDGWFYTGDYGWFDTDGYLHFAGLKKRIAKVAGNMVDLSEVEREILACPDVIDARIYTVPDANFGEVVSADVTYRNADDVDAKSIRRYLKNRLASYKIPHIQGRVIE